MVPESYVVRQMYKGLQKVRSLRALSPRPLAVAALCLEAMATVTDIGSLISRTPGLHGGRPCIAGTGVTVRRVAVLHNAGDAPEEIAANYRHLSLAQVHAAHSERGRRIGAAMTVSAHFDGKVIVPDEPLDLLPN